MIFIPACPRRAVRNKHIKVTCERQKGRCDVRNKTGAHVWLTGSVVFPVQFTTAMPENKTTITLSHLGGAGRGFARLAGSFTTNVSIAGLRKGRWVSKQCFSHVVAHGVHKNKINNSLTDILIVGCVDISLIRLS